MRKDFELDGLEVLELMCDLLHERSGVLSQSKCVPADLAECVQTLLWCAPRLAQEVPEMRTVHEQLSKKYSGAYAKATERFAAAAVSSSPPPPLPSDVPVLADFKCCVNGRVLRVLTFAAPPTEKVKEYLSAIALEFGVEVDSDRLDSAVQENPLGGFSQLPGSAGGTVPTPVDPSTQVSGSAPADEEEETARAPAAAAGFGSGDGVPVAHPVPSDQAYSHGFSAGFAAAMQAETRPQPSKGPEGGSGLGGGHGGGHGGGQGRLDLQQMQAAHMAAAAATPDRLPTSNAPPAAAPNATPSDLAARFARLKQG